MCFNVITVVTLLITVSSLVTLIVVCQAEQMTDVPPVCPGCYEGLCSRDNYTLHVPHLLMKLYPGLFKTVDELDYVDCPLDDTPPGPKQEELHFNCPGEAEGGCKKDGHTPVWGACCVTCEYRSVPWHVQPENGQAAYVVQLLDVDGGRYQSYPKGYCGQKRQCSRCETYQVLQTFLVAPKPVFNVTQLEQTTFWFAQVSVDGFCYCISTDKDISTDKESSGGINQLLSPGILMLAVLCAAFTG